MKIRAVRTELLHADGRTDGQTDMTKLTVTFRSFTSAPEKDTRSKSDILHVGCLERCTISVMERNKHTSISTTRINTVRLYRQ